MYEDPQLLHEDQFLTQISVAYDQENSFIGEQLFPAVNVDFQSDKYRVFNKDNEARVTDDHRSPGARANELPPAMLPGEDKYFATEHKLKDVVTPEERQNRDTDQRTRVVDADPYTEATERLTDTILLNREYALLQMILNPANYAAGHTDALTGTERWDDYTNSSPAANLKVARKAIPDALGRNRNPNRLVIGDEIKWILEDHPKVVDKLGSAMMQMTTDDVIAKVLRFPATPIWASAQYNTAPYGQPASMVDLWGKNVLMAWVPESPGKRIPAFGYEFVWPYPSGERQRTDRWYDTDREADLVRVGRRYDQKFIAIDGSGLAIGGYLFTTVIS